MTLQYAMLTYKGDVTGSPNARPGRLLGHDEVGRYYEVVDADCYHEGDLADPNSTDETEQFCGLCERTETHTHVNIQWATESAMKAELELLTQAMQERATREREELRRKSIKR